MQRGGKLDQSPPSPARVYLCVGGELNTIVQYNEIVFLNFVKDVFLPINIQKK